jgi:hypothetical protein
VFCLAGAIAAASSLAASLILATGRIDLVTKVELTFQPLRAAMIVLAAVVFKTTMACTLALVLSLLIQLPMVYFTKGFCVPNDYRRLAKGLGKSAKVTLACLALPAALALLTPVARGTATGMLAFAAAALMCVICWVIAVMRFRHPLAADPAFLRISDAGLARLKGKAGG